MADYGLTAVLQNSFDNRTNNMFTAIPCIVIAVRNNLSTMVVDIQPSIHQKSEAGAVTPRPPILGVPVQFPVSKSAGITFPINVGDLGIALFSMRSMDGWKAGNGYPSAPLTAAKFDKGDAIFIPGIQPESVAVNNPDKRFWEHDPADLVVVNNIGTEFEAELRIKPSGNVIINTKAKVEVNCNEAEVIADTSLSLHTAELTVNAIQTYWTGDIQLVGNLSQSGNYTTIGTLSFNGIDFSNHRHPENGDITSGPTN